MEHLSERSRLNSMITTITAHADVRPLLEADRDQLELDRTLVAAAVADVLRRNPHVTAARASFKNCQIVRLPVRSVRGKPRYVSIKVFRNLTLHVAGCHSLEMIDAAVDFMVGQLAQSLPSIRGGLGTGTTTVTMVNYTYSLPGPVQLQALAEFLRDEYGMLVLFDPSKYAGANVKFPIPDGCVAAGAASKRPRVEKHTYVSIMVFESRKIIISAPRCVDRDGLLALVVRFIERAMVHYWSRPREA